MPALEFDCGAVPTTDALRDALATALAAHPRFASTFDRGWWVPTCGPEDVPVTVGDDLDTVRRAVADVWFPPPAPVSLRLGVADSTLVVAWRHAVSDAAGGVGFASTLLRALAGARGDAVPSVTSRSTTRAVWRDALAPSAAAAFVRKARHFGTGTHAEFPRTAPVAAESATVRWEMSEPLRRDVAHAARRAGGSFIAALVRAAAHAVVACTDADAPVTMLVPVNLRPHGADRWTPAANLVGNVECAFGAPPTIADAAAQVAAADGPDRYAAWWAAFARDVLPARIARRGEDPDGRLGRTVVVNNLGAVTADRLPGVHGGAFLGPNAVDFPSIAVFSVDRTTTCTVRVREHQGGRDIAEALSAAFRDALFDGV